MNLVAFEARCPYEIGDKIRTRRDVRVASLADSGEPIYEEEVHTITDIVCTHYLKSGTVEFLYELDNSRKLVHIIAPIPEGAAE